MEILNSNTHLSEKQFFNTNFTNPGFSKNISSLKTAYTSFQNSNQNNKLLSSYERYKNQKLLNSAQINTNHCHKCHPHHFHIHHIHIPQGRLYEALNLKNLNLGNTSDLMKEVLELKNECRKFREELNKNQNEKIAGDLYIKELENKNININEENNFNRYHEMLDKGFEVLNSVSQKCNDENAKTKGGIYYYKNKDNDYNKLIEAQKNWIDNLPENNTFPQNNQLFQNTSPLNKTYQINDQLNNILSKNKNRKTSPNNYNPNEQNKIIDSNNDYDNEQNRNQLNNEKFPNKKNNKLFFDSKRNNNKGYIIKKGEKINNNQNEERDINEFKNNYITDPNINSKSKSNQGNSILSNQPNMNYNSFPQSNNKNSNNKEKNMKDNKDVLINSEEKKEDQKNPLNERYLIVDKDGNPILNNGEKIYGIELLPLIDEDGKEVIDDNGNIVLIGPNGDPKSQDELEPILINNDSILVNEENKPFLGLDGSPLINNEGNPITGPDELLDKDNKKIKGIIGYIAKDNKANPIKINIKENNKKNEIKDIAYDYNKLRPLIGSDGKPILDSNKNFIILDQNNKPVENKDIKLLLSEDGTPMLNKRGKPILTDKDENPLNNDDMNDIEIKHFKKRRDKIKNRRKNKNEKNVINYSECNPESLKKINFLRPYKNPFYDDLEYKGSCFACDVGCSVSKSGYSIMNYSPYNNLIRRRNTTPIKIINENGKRYKRNSKKNERPNYKRYYLS